LGNLYKMMQPLSHKQSECGSLRSRSCVLTRRSPSVSFSACTHRASRLTRRGVLSLGASSFSFLASRSVKGFALGCAPIASSFVQPADNMRARGTQEWVRELEVLRYLGCSDIYLQWLQLNDDSFFDSIDTPDPRRFSTAFIAAAAHLGLGVVFGLSAELRHVRQLYATPAALDKYLAQIRGRSLQLAKNIFAANLTSTCRFYLPEELDDLSLSDPGRADVWVEHLRTTHRQLSDIGNSDIIISSYVTGRQTPEQYSAVWDRIWSRTPVILLLQDGYGAHHFKDPERVWNYADALRAVADRHHRQWGIIIELFDLLSGPPVSTGPYFAQPTTFERLSRQLRRSEDYAGTIRAAYSMTEHMADAAGPMATALREAYRSHYC
jgi:Domain of unknown function (DUF4434)